MKSVGCAVSAVAFVVAGSAYAQESPPEPPMGGTSAPPAAAAPAAVARRDQTLTVNPLAMVGGSFNGEYERAIGPGMSIFVGPSVAYASANLGTSSISMYGLGGTGGLRMFFAAEAPKGGWIGPQASLVYISADFGGGDSLSAVGFSIAGLAGYTWIFDSGFVLS